MPGACPRLIWKPSVRSLADKKDPRGCSRESPKRKNLTFNLMRTNQRPPSPALIAARVESHDWQMSQALHMCVAFEWDLKRTIDEHFSGVSPQRQAIFKDLIRRFAQVKKEALALKKEIDSELKSRSVAASEDLF